MNDITPHQSDIGYEERCEQYQQTGEIIWFTGLSGAGKTTLATLLEEQLIRTGKIVCLLDGDSLRDSLNSDLHFSDEARKENIRRITELAIYLAKQAFIVLVSVISPHQSMRQIARKKASIANLKFTEIYVKASIETCKERDPKNLYKKVEAGQLKHFTGIESLYEPPDSADITLDTEVQSIESCLDMMNSYFKSNTHCQ